MSDIKKEIIRILFKRPIEDKMDAEDTADEILELFKDKDGKVSRNLTDAAMKRELLISFRDWWWEYREDMSNITSDDLDNYFKSQ